TEGATAVATRRVAHREDAEAGAHAQLQPPIRSRYDETAFGLRVREDRSVSRGDVDARLDRDDVRVLPAVAEQPDARAESSLGAVDMSLPAARRRRQGDRDRR